MFSFGFFSPWLLTLLPLGLAALVYIYKQRNTTKRVQVSTLLFLKGFSKRAPSRSKFSPPPRFFFELALISLLILAASGLYRSGPSQTIAILIDNSFSMSALEADTDQSTVLDRAIEGVKQELLKMGSDVLVELFTTAPSLLSLTSSVVSAAEAERALQRVAASFSAGEIESGLQRLASGGAYNQIIVFSDRTAIYPERAKDSISFRQMGRLAQMRSNVAIENVSFEPAAEVGAELGQALGYVTATVRSFSEEEISLKILVESFDPGSGSFAIISSQEASLPPFAQTSIQAAGSARAYRVLLTSLKGADLLPGDNSAWLSSEVDGRTVILVSEFTPAELGLLRLGNFSFKHIPPASYLGYSPAAEDVFIFHRFVPKEFPDSDSLFILPPERNSLFVTRHVRQKLDLTHWQENHPLLSYLNLPLLSPLQAAVFTPPEWGQELIRVNEGTLLFEGKRAGKTYIALGMEIFPYEGKSSPLLSVFTLNLLRFLNQNLSLSSGFISTYGSLPEQLIGPATSIVAIDGQLAGQKVALSSGFGLPGLYKLNYSDRLSEKLAAVNFFDPLESNLNQRRTVTVPEMNLATELKHEPISLIKLLSLLVLALIFIELIFSAAVSSKARQFFSLRRPV
jgi:hypothetical protein